MPTKRESALLRNIIVGEPFLLLNLWKVCLKMETAQFLDSPVLRQTHFNFHGGEQAQPTQIQACVGCRLAGSSTYAKFATHPAKNIVPMGHLVSPRVSAKY